MHMTFPVRLLPDREELAPPGLWPDSFLNTNQAEHRSGSLPPRLYTARKTIELCACGYRKYTVWSFADRLHGVDSIREKDSSDFSYNTYNIENNPNVHEDQIAFGRAMDANIPIMDAREYILVQFSINIEKVLEYWSDTVKSHKKPFEDHVRQVFGALVRPLTLRSGAKH